MTCLPLTPVMRTLRAGPASRSGAAPVPVPAPVYILSPVTVPPEVPLGPPGLPDDAVAPALVAKLGDLA